MSTTDESKDLSSMDVSKYVIEAASYSKADDNGNLVPNNLISTSNQAFFYYKTTTTSPIIYGAKDFIIDSLFPALNSLNNKRTIQTATSASAFTFSTLEARDPPQAWPTITGNNSSININTVFPTINSILTDMKANQLILPDIVSVNPNVYMITIYRITVFSILGRLKATAADATNLQKLKDFLLSSSMLKYVGQTVPAYDASSNPDSLNRPITYKVIKAALTQYDSSLSNDSGNFMALLQSALGITQPIVTGASTSDITRLPVFGLYNRFQKIWETMQGSTKKKGQSLFDYWTCHLALVVNMYYVCMKIASIFDHPDNMTLWKTTPDLLGFKSTYLSSTTDITAFVTAISNQASTGVPTYLSKNYLTLYTDLRTVNIYLLVLSTVTMTYSNSFGYIYDYLNSTSDASKNNNSLIDLQNADYESHMNILGVLRKKNERLSEQAAQEQSQLYTTIIIFTVFCLIMIGVLVYDGFNLDTKAVGVMLVNATIGLSILGYAFYQLIVKK